MRVSPSQVPPVVLRLFSRPLESLHNRHVLNRTASGIMLPFQESRQSARDGLVDMPRGRRLILWGECACNSKTGLPYTAFLVTAGPRRTAVKGSMAVSPALFASTWDLRSTWNSDGWSADALEVPTNTFFVGSASSADTDSLRGLTRGHPQVRSRPSTAVRCQPHPGTWYGILVGGLDPRQRLPGR